MALRTVNLPFESAKTHLPPDPNAEGKYSMSEITRLTLLWGKKNKKKQKNTFYGSLRFPSSSQIPTNVKLIAHFNYIIECTLCVKHHNDVKVHDNRVFYSKGR